MTILYTVPRTKRRSANGLFTLRGNGTIGNNGSWFLSLSQTSVNISTWYYIFHLIPVPVLAPCSVNIPLERRCDPYLIYIPDDNINMIYSRKIHINLVKLVLTYSFENLPSVRVLVQALLQSLFPLHQAFLQFHIHEHMSNRPAG